MLDSDSLRHLRESNMIQRFWRQLVRFGFRLLYNELAWSYDAVSWLVSLGEWREWQRCALDEIRGREVLEIGHGPGHMLLALESRGVRPTGLDLSPSMGRLARQRTSAPLVQGTAQKLPFGTAVFDTVLATFPTEYFVDPETLTAVSRILRPGGRFVIVPEAHLTGKSVLHRLIDWAFRVTGQQEDAFAADAAGWPAQDHWEVLAAAFESCRLSLERRRVIRPRSVVTLLIATRI